MRLLLIRHGRSAHLHRGGLLDGAGMRTWRADYDAAGIAERDEPPALLRAEVSRADVLASSDLARAVTSATRLAGGRSFTISSLLREVPLPIPALPISAPFALWGAAIHGRYLLDILRGRDLPADAREQLDAAATWCAGLAREHPDGTLAAVTHGVFRRLLSRRLLAEGWQLESRSGGYSHWSVWRLTRK